MTRDDIIRMAREAGASFETAESMFRFAAIVAAAEREACAAICESTHANGTRKYTHADECAAAIRARGES